ncbi:hypothetical protein HELRODRAFT_159340 [Helobdella robusta]|uniref:SUEL-type lectin domain-containing protein n=1 Tax=Helobdella robusta TaxID=6412 RepID=T1ENX0_HELRO|nr:hypothetical protein HELRODRAFT_159340 [Helobdella robusta]ESO12758.1 hypothetical protein HELRODRAFT_159340 [Helobdella robusta]
MGRRFAYHKMNPILENQHNFCLQSNFEKYTHHNIKMSFEHQFPMFPKSLILITQANYGRMKDGRCIGGQLNTGCSMGVTTYLDSQCSGKDICDMSVRNLVDIHPCQRDFMSYLEASYICITVVVSCVARPLQTIPSHVIRTGVFVAEVITGAVKRIMTLDVKKNPSDRQLHVNKHNNNYTSVNNNNTEITTTIWKNNIVE